MVYKWCVVPQCTNTSIKSPHKLFVSVPTNPERRKMWLKLAGRDPKSILSHSNVFMCEDHFDMEKATINYMKYKMGFSQKILLADGAVPTKFNYQEDRNRQLSVAGSSREVFSKRQRIDLITECRQSQSTTGTHAKSLQKDDDMIQEIIGHEESPKTQDKEIITDPIITEEKSVQVTTKVNMDYISKAVQTRYQNKSISTSPLKVSTTFTSPFQIEPCRLQPPQSEVVKSVKRNIVIEDEKSNSDIPNLESSHLSPFVATSSLSNVTDSDSNSE